MNPASPLQVAELPIGHPSCCASGGIYATRRAYRNHRGDDAGEGTHGGLFDGVPLGPGLCARTGQAMPNGQSQSPTEGFPP